MKNLLFLLSFVCSTSLIAQPNTFEQSIKSQLNQISIASTTEDWLNLSLNLSKIAKNHPKQWLANYYTAYAYMQLASTYEDQTLPEVATHLDQAQIALDKAKHIKQNHSELMVLQGFIYMGRIWESPFLNGGLYGRKISQLFKQAIELNATNPRAYYLKGLLTYHTPRFVGGGKDRAKPWLVTAQEKFGLFEMQTTISPNWGIKANQALLLECGGQKEGYTIKSE